MEMDARIDAFLEQEGLSMRVWFDTEFHEDGRTIDLISIGIVTEDGRDYHGVNGEYDWNRAHSWLRQNVEPSVRNEPRKSRVEIRDDIRAFVGSDKPEFWAYFGEYDWIALRQLFGDMMAWPTGWPLLHLDVEQLRLSNGGPELPKHTGTVHNALDDARWTRECWQHLHGLA